jgi:chromosome segregation ATPase
VKAELQRIQEKLQELLRQQQLLKKQNEQLLASLAASEQKSTAHQQRIEELQQQVSVLKMNAAQLNPQDKKELEKKINQYLKEIDRCIAQLGE